MEIRNLWGVSFFTSGHMYLPASLYKYHNKKGEEEYVVPNTFVCTLLLTDRASVRSV